ncbi:MAG: ABC transporter permease [Alphaproteobacteria bacterium]
MWRRIRGLIVKEFLALWRDPKSRFVVIGPPLFQLLVFGYAATYDVTHVPTAIYDEDRGPAARDLVAGFEGSPTFDIVGRLERDRDIAAAIDARRAGLVVHIGQDFSADLAAGRTAHVQVIVDGRESNTALVVLGYAATVVADFNGEWLRERGLSQPPAELVVRSWFNPNLVSRWFIVPGIVALLTLVVSMVLTALTVARERELGTFDQLLVTPLRPFEILVGKTAPALVIGMLEASLIVTVAIFWFQVPFRGELPLLYAGLFLFLLSTTGVGLMISSLAATQQQAILGTFLFVVPAVILSGFATPVANMPLLVQHLTLVNPMRYFLVIVRGSFLEAMPVALVVQELWPMALIAAVTLVAAALLFRRRLQ